MYRLLVPWRSYIVVLTPLLVLPLALSKLPELRCSYVVVIMAVYWMTEALPLPVTSMIPIFMYPLLGILSTEEVCLEYLNSTNMMFLGGLIAAVAIECSMLHYRIALKITLLVGTTPMRIMAGLMLSTMFISSWISNSAATALVTPIVHAIRKQLAVCRRRSFDEDTDLRTHSFTKVVLPTESATEQGTRQMKPDDESTGFYIAVAYAANIGGISTLIASPPNMVVKGIYDGRFNETDSVSLTFARWSMFGMPYAVVATLATLIFLQIFFMRLFREKTPDQLLDVEHREAIRLLLEQEARSLGAINFHQAVVMTAFIILVFLWIMRAPSPTFGWGRLFRLQISDASAVMMVVILFSAIPADLSFFRFSAPYENPTPSILNWDDMHTKTPWGIMLLLGGSFAMARGMKVSGLAEATGDLLMFVKGMPEALIMIIASCTAALLSVFSSNTAIANIVLPVLAEISVSLKIKPLYLMIPAAMSCSLAFALPASTPPNAIAYDAGGFATTVMMKVGLGVTVICLILLIIMFLSFGVYVFQVD